MDNGGVKIFEGTHKDCVVFLWAYEFANPYHLGNIAKGRWFTWMGFRSEYYAIISLERSIFNSLNK